MCTNSHLQFNFYDFNRKICAEMIAIENEVECRVQCEETRKMSSKTVSSNFLETRNKKRVLRNPSSYTPCLEIVVRLRVTDSTARRIETIRDRGTGNATSSCGCWTEQYTILDAEPDRDRYHYCGRFRACELGLRGFDKRVPRNNSEYTTTHFRPRRFAVALTWVHDLPFTPSLAVAHNLSNTRLYRVFGTLLAAPTTRRLYDRERTSCHARRLRRLEKCLHHSTPAFA